MALRNITLNRSAVRALLTSPEMQQAVRRAGEQIAARVRATGSPTYGALNPQVTVVATGGAKGDRAAAHVVIPPPAPSDVRYPDTDGRFGVLVQVAREVSG